MSLIDEKYLDRIRAENCVACHKFPVDADHLQARQWRQSNRNDYSALPLCRECHTERHQIGNKKFEEKWHLNLWQEVAKRLFPIVAEAQSRKLALVKG